MNVAVRIEGGSVNRQHSALNLFSQDMLREVPGFDDPSQTGIIRVGYISCLAF